MSEKEAARSTLQKVSDELQKEVLSDLEGGRDQSLALVDSAVRETAEAVSKIRETSTKQAELLKRQILGSAELESRNFQLRTVEEEVNGIFEDAIKGVSEIPTTQYEEALSRLINEGVRLIGSKATVSCSSKDRKTATAVIKKLNKGDVKLTLDEKSIETFGGVVLTSPDGTVSFDNTFEARLERMKQVLRKDVASLLMTDSGARLELREEESSSSPPSPSA
jgi:V/A-type H+-transporting ATPase subunit E